MLPPDNNFAVTSLPPGASVDADGNLLIAMLVLDLNPQVERIAGLHWLPEFFSVPLSDELREVLVKTLRFHADKLENRELDARMSQFTLPPEIPTLF